MKRLTLLPLLALLAGVTTTLPPAARAADRVWTNTTVGDFLNASNWSPNTVPGAADNARFQDSGVALVTWSASRTNANAFFNNTNGSIQQFIGTNFWLLTNSYIVGQNAGSTSTVLHGSGQLRVTNAAGTARLVIGENGKGTYTLAGTNASIVTDHLIVTNVTAGATNSLFNFASGSLTINEGSIIRTGGNDFLIGSATNQTATLNILGGTNIVDGGAFGDTVLGGVTNGVSRVTVTGPGTVWSNRNSLHIGRIGSGSRLVVSNGATVANTVGYLGYNSNANNNVALVTGAGSLWTNSVVLYVGRYGSGNQLVVSNGGTVANDFGYLGFTSTSSNNVAVVTGAGSRWNNSSVLHVGSSGSGNRLVVSNGGTVANTDGYLGLLSTADSNVVVVTGAGSLWINSSGLTVGYIGSGNRLVVSNGGTVANTTGYLGFNSDNNVAVVTGAGSLWTNSGDLYVGFSGSGNQLVVSNGGTVANTTGTLGFTNTANNNLAVVTGAGSRWRNADLFVGNSGSSNRLLITNGGTVTAADELIVGVTTNSAANRLIVDGGTLLVSNAVGVGTLDVRRGTNVLNAGLMDVERLLVTNTLGIFEFNGGTLLTRGAFISNGAPFSVGRAGAATWDVRASASNHVLDGDLFIGSNASFNRLLVTNGARLTNDGAGYLGLSLGADSNAVAVAGAGSSWRMAGNLVLASNGAFNLLLISNGGFVLNESAELGRWTAGSNNLVLVTGAGSVWSNRGNLAIGVNGDGNRMVITNGGVVGNDNGRIGSFVSATGNRVEVAGAGSVWGNTNDLFLGQNGPGNSLRVTAGGRVINANAVIGDSSSADGNEALVSGAGSLWSNRFNLTVGRQGSQSRLLISNNGLVTVGGLMSIGAESNVLGVSLSNRVIINGGTLRVANGTATAVLDVRRGTNELLGGLLVADTLLLTNPLGYFTFQGGALHVEHLTNSNGRAFVVGDGAGAAELRLLGGVHSFANSLVLSSNAMLTGKGVVIGAVTNFGVISPGLSTGELTIQGNLLLRPSANLTFELGGLLAGFQHDQLTVTNFVEFAGTLSLALLPDFLPENEDSFTLLRFATSSGAFTNAPLGGRVNLTNNLASFAVNYSFTNIVIGDIEYVDTDGDGQPDLFEQAAGTDAADSTDVLMITSLTVDALGRYVVQFQSVAGKSYRVEYTDNFVTWNPAVGAVFTAPSPGVGQWVDDGSLTGGLAVGNRSYRIGLQ